MHKFKFIIIIGLFLPIITSAVFIPVATKGYLDTTTHWSEPYAINLKQLCDIKGYKNQQGIYLNEFHPDSPITRAELVKMLNSCSKTVLPFVENQVFTDLDSNSWYTKDINAAQKLGWVSGYPDQTFRPNNQVNRAEAVKIILLSHNLGSLISASNSTFNDVSSTAWYAKYITYANNHGWINGFSDHAFRPSAPITRAEAAKIISLVYGFTKTEAAIDNSIASALPTTTAPTSPSPVSSNNSSPTIAGCSIFPADNAWNQDISKSAVSSNSANYIRSIGLEKYLHPDFGSNPEYGIPYTVVDGNVTPKVTVTADYADESDFGLAPIPANPPIEGGTNADGDRHVIVLDKSDCSLYETWDSHPNGQNWQVGSAAKFNLKSNALRPDNWTSADAAGLPILPGLVRLDEVKSRHINHALRFTVSKTQKAFIHPATHFAASSTDSNLPPMGLRLRLKADFDTSKFTGDSLVILNALKQYGMIVADNGSDWFISGETNPNWNEDDLSQLKKVPGNAFEAVETGPIIK